MTAIQSPQQQTLILHDISWETYERLLADHADRSAPRFTYDQGALEIMSPVPEHERYRWALERLVEIVAERRGLDYVNLGSTTFKREDIQRGFEPDGCFYIRHAAEMKARDRIDLSVDPPPELVIEVAITHTSLSKLPIFAQFGVTEVWRYDGERFDVWVLEEGRYAPSERSDLLPIISADAISRLLEEGKEEGISGVDWVRRVRAWTRTLVEKTES
jgi:Uma2 family endonuclease